jgi:hypothetical protein
LQKSLDLILFCLTTIELNKFFLFQRTLGLQSFGLIKLRILQEQLGEKLTQLMVVVVVVVGGVRSEEEKGEKY